MSGPLPGKLALVTGAAQGLGQPGSIVHFRRKA